MPYTEAQKRATLKWRQTNNERYSTYLKEYNKQRYNADERSKRYYYSKEAKIFLNILL